MRAAFCRWHVEKWFEQAKQGAGLRAFGVRTYRSLIRHWLCCRLAIMFLAGKTARLRGKNPRISFERVAEASNLLLQKISGQDWRSYRELIPRFGYQQRRNASAYCSRLRRVSVVDDSP